MRLRRSDDGLLEEWDVDARLKPRAPRYSLALPLIVRKAGDAFWTPGTTANASRTGMLFVADAWWPPETPIELGFDLTADPSAASPRVTCAAVVVRSTRLPSAERAAIAVRISAYRFVGDCDEAAGPQPRS